MILEILGHDLVTYMKEITCFVLSNNVLNILVDFQNNIKWLYVI